MLWKSFNILSHKADSPAMIKHAMDILQRVTTYLHPGHLCQSKVHSMIWPATYGENVFLIMFGGLHLEMGMWNMLGNYLACSGWTTALADAHLVQLTVS